MYLCHDNEPTAKFPPVNKISFIDYDEILFCGNLISFERKCQKCKI